MWAPWKPCRDSRRSSASSAGGWNSLPSCWMNAAKGSKEVDALEKPMAAVINELVVQRKALRSMMMEMQPAMMAHMIHHMHMHGTKGAMECPMMKTGNSPEPKAEETKPKM